MGKLRFKRLRRRLELLLKVTPKDTSYPNPETYLSVWFPGEKAHNFVQLPQLGFGGLPAGDDEYGEDPKSELSELNKLPEMGSDLTKSGSRSAEGNFRRITKAKDTIQRFQGPHRNIWVLFGFDFVRNYIICVR